jgi:hypothetical protein
MLDDYAEQVLKELQSSATAFTTLWESGQMPVLKYDDAFKTWRHQQIHENQILVLVEDRITCTLAWQVLKHLESHRKDSDRLYWSQGNIGSCTGHADAFAHHSAVLHGIARGTPLNYCPVNPLVTWAITKGGSLRGGQTLSEAAGFEFWDKIFVNLRSSCIVVQLNNNDIHYIDFICPKVHRITG